MPADSQAFMATWKGKPIEGMLSSREVRELTLWMAHSDR